MGFQWQLSTGDGNERKMRGLWNADVQARFLLEQRIERVSRVRKVGVSAQGSQAHAPAAHFRLLQFRAESASKDLALPNTPKLRLNSDSYSGEPRSNVGWRGTFEI